MPGSLLVAHYETSTGQYYFQKVGSAQISDGAVTSGKIGANAIWTGHITDLAVTSAKLAAAIINLLGSVADGGITSAKIASGAVGGVHIANATIASSDIAVNTIGGIHILDGSIVSGDIAANVLATPHILNQGILSASLAAGVIGDTLVANYGIVSGKYASGSITEGALVSGISIDISEISQEPSFRAQVPISGFLAVQYSVSGYFSFAQAADADTMPAIGVATAFINSGQIGAFQYGGRMTDAGWDFSGYVGSLLFTGTSSEVTLMVSGLMVSGRCVQRLAKVADADTIFIKPDLVFAQIAE